MLLPPYFQRSVGSITPGYVQNVAGADPVLAAKMEAMMMVVRMERDDKGFLLGSVLSPAVALALILVIESTNPIATAENITRTALPDDASSYR